MKKTLLILMMASMLALTARGQVLQNTHWRSYDTLNTPGVYWRFIQDTLRSSFDDINYNNVSTYVTNPGNIDLIDINPIWCGVNYTGHYHYTITIDTLRFYLYTDTCSARKNFLLMHYLLRLPTGIETTTPISSATIYPNPSADGIFNLMLTGNGNMPNKIYVLNVDGRKIMDETFSSAATNHSINLQSCASGIYFLVMENEKGRRVAKLVR